MIIKDDIALCWVLMMGGSLNLWGMILTFIFPTYFSKGIIVISLILLGMGAIYLIKDLCLSIFHKEIKNN